MSEKPKNDTPEELEMIEVLENPPVAKAEAPEKLEKPKKDEEEDKRLSADSDEDDKDDETPNADPEQEKLRQERRLRRKIQKDFRREQREKERLELEELRVANRQLLERMQQIEATQTGTAETTLKANLRQSVQVYEEATEDLRLAVEAGDGKRATAALERRDKAKETAQMLDQQLRRLQNNGKKPMGPDPEETRLYREWIAKNTWFDQSLKNEESRMARVVNDALLSEGYQPNTPAFWNELSNRVEKFVKVKKTDRREESGDMEEIEEKDPPARRGGPPVAGSGREAASAGKNKVYISPERKRAMQEAGAWDDPGLRQKYLRAYAKYDRENPPQRAN